MSNHRYHGQNSLAAIAMAIGCVIAMPIATAQDNPNPGARRPPASRYAPLSTVPGVRLRAGYDVSLLPANSIHVTVHYPDAYGYLHAAGLFDAGPNSCDAFSVSIVPEVASPNEPVGIHVEPAMRRASGLYWCEYFAQDLPRDVPIDVRVALSDEQNISTEAWMGGIESQPPTGQRRVIGGDARTVILDNSTPGAALVFWMDYATQPTHLQRLQPPLRRVGTPVPQPLFNRSRRDPKVP